MVNEVYKLLGVPPPSFTARGGSTYTFLRRWKGYLLIPLHRYCNGLFDSEGHEKRHWVRRCRVTAKGAGISR